MCSIPPVASLSFDRRLKWDDALRIINKPLKWSGCGCEYNGNILLGLLGWSSTAILSGKCSREYFMVIFYGKMWSEERVSIYISPTNMAECRNRASETTKEWYAFAVRPRGTCRLWPSYGHHMAIGKSWPVDGMREQKGHPGIPRFHRKNVREKFFDGDLGKMPHCFRHTWMGVHLLALRLACQ